MLGASTTVLVLLAVVWLGMSGRAERPSPPPEINRPSPQLALVTPSATDATTPKPSPAATSTATVPPTATPRPTHAPLARPAVLSVTGSVGGSSFWASLVEARPGRLAGQHWTVSPPDGDTLSFQLAEVQHRTTGTRERPLGSWELSLDELAANHRTGQRALTATVPARPQLLGAPVPVQRGYTLEVTVRLAFDEVAAIDFIVELGPNRRVYGEDGIFGWPREANLDSLLEARASRFAQVPRFPISAGIASSRAASR